MKYVMFIWLVSLEISNFLYHVSFTISELKFNLDLSCQWDVDWTKAIRTFFSSKYLSKNLVKKFLITDCFDNQSLI